MHGVGIVEIASTQIDSVSNIGMLALSEEVQLADVARGT